MAIAEGTGDHAQSNVPASSVSIDATQPAGEKKASRGSSEKYYRPELDWLRFMAFSAVFLLHALPSTPESFIAVGVPNFIAYFISPLIESGGYGVDLFFALSAYLITELLLLERGRTGRVHIRSFYVRRVLRIWPLYFTFIFIVAAFEVYLHGNPISYYVALLAFSGNWYVVFMPQLMSVCGPLWSVCIEEQFYIVWPNLVGRVKQSWFPYLMILLFAFTCVFRLLYVQDPPTVYAVWYHTFTRLDAFAMGGFLAYLLHGRGLTFSFAYRVCFLAVGIGLFWFLGSQPYGGYYGTLPVWTYPVAALASVCCIVAFVTSPPRHAFGKPLQALSYLGKISYGLYVFHYAAVRFSHVIVRDGAISETRIWVVRAFIAGTITLVLSMISYAVLEKPFLRLKRRFTYVQSRPE